MGKMYVKIENKVRYVQWEKNIFLMEVTFDLMKASIFATTVFYLPINGCCNSCRSHHPLLQLRNVVIVISSCDIFELGEI